MDERVRLAQELHDGIAQDLVGLGYRVDALVAQVGTPNTIRAELRFLRFALTGLVEKVRSEIIELRRPATVLSSPSTFQSSTNYELQRSFAELVRNIHAHSLATQLTISLSDNGVGGAFEKPGHHGLAGVRERIEDLGGQFSIRSDSNGTTVLISLPVTTQ